jgi:hypothetical protein
VKKSVHCRAPERGLEESLDIPKSFLPGDGTMVPVEEAEEEESSRDSLDTGISSSSSRPSSIGGSSGGSLERCDLAKDF